MELQDMRTAVLYRAGMDPLDGMVPSAVLNSFINGAIRQVTIMQDWDWNWSSETITSVVDQDAYDRAADARKTDMVHDIVDGGLLEQINPRMAHRYNPTQVYSGRTSIARFWYVQNGQLYLVPTPQSIRTYNHVYVSTETILVNDTDEPGIPDYAIDIVLVKAAMMVTARTDNTSQHRLLADEERDLLDSLDDEARRSRGSSIIRSRRDWRI